MSGRPWPTRLAVVGVSAFAVGCGLADLFEAAEPAAVTLSYEGATSLTVGERAPFTIRVRADGEVLPSARLEFTVSDAQVFALTGRRDSLVGLAVGQADLVARLVDAILADSMPTLVQRIHVTGGPAAPPRR